MTWAARECLSLWHRFQFLGRLFVDHLARAPCLRVPAAVPSPFLAISGSKLGALGEQR